MALSLPVSPWRIRTWTNKPNGRICCWLIVTAGLVFGWGCQQKMANQPRYEPLEPSRFFADGRSARPLLPGVLPRGGLQEDPHFYRGISSSVSGDAVLPPTPSLDQAEHYADTFPLDVQETMVRRGQERFQVTCAPCHGPLGTGSGPVVEHGYPPAASFHTARLRQAPPGYLFDVITRGYRNMPSYAQQVPPRERWEIITYIRALQLSQYAELDRLPGHLRERFVQPP